MTEPRKIIIDTDPGQDDAAALMLAFASPDELELLAELTDHRGVGHARSRRRVRVTTSAEAEALGLAVARELLAG